MSKEIIDELKLIGNYFDIGGLDVSEHKHHIRFTSIIKDRIDFYVNKSKMNLHKELIDFLEANNWLSLEGEENAKGVIESYIKVYKPKQK
mgnify:CR=1 FL=1|jgi:hypothetical protein|tara:strand:+ start:1645 stop:1914 length:270 start_codon:yes stop_codon:yes gene_type:complete